MCSSPNPCFRAQSRILCSTPPHPHPCRKPLNPSPPPLGPSCPGIFCSWHTAHCVRAEIISQPFGRPARTPRDWPGEQGGRTAARKNVYAVLKSQETAMPGPQGKTSVVQVMQAQRYTGTVHEFSSGESHKHNTSREEKVPTWEKQG